MKRVRAACLNQTIQFRLKEEIDHETTVRNIREEYNNYKKQMESNGTLYKILEETEFADGSIQIKVKKQINNYDIGDYLKTE